MTATLAQLITRHNIDVDPHLQRDLTIPILTGLQRQGDVLVIPASHGRQATTPVPATGTAVVRGENGGNTHAIVGDAYCDTRSATARSLTLATLTVPDGGAAYLAHPEHGLMGIGPGTYDLRRQRERREEISLVQD